jgi:DivIVA domain-containing protein
VRVPLERQSIEKKDFPIGRRGYDPDAVDAHLAHLADEVDELKLSSRRRSETLASAASEQVRAIVEAAEKSAADIQRQAEDEAREIRAEAADEARTTREQATNQAREYVGKVSESTSVMMQRLDAMENELTALIEALRTGSNRLGADLQLLESNLEEVRVAVDPRPRFEDEAAAAATDESAPAWSEEVVESAPEPEAEVVSDHDYGQEHEHQPEYAHEVEPEPVDYAAAASHEAAAPAYAEPAALETPRGDDDTEGARLIALNMALNGTPREETDRYLAENFTLHNRAELLDEVYASVEG